MRSNKALIFSFLSFLYTAVALRITKPSRISPWKEEKLPRVSALRSGVPNGFREAAEGFSEKEWYDMDGCSVILPPREQAAIPRAVVHFLGGFVAGSAAPVAYGKTLSDIADAGYLVVVSPIPALQTNHSSIAVDVAITFAQCYKNRLLPLMGGGDEALQVPIIGLSHSLGGKLTALMHSRKDLRRLLPPRTANVFLAFNNFGFKQSLEMSQSQLGGFDSRVQEMVDAVNTPQVQSLIDLARGAKDAPSAVGNMLFGAMGSAAAAAMDTASARNNGRGMSEGEKEKFSRAVADRLKDAVGSQMESVSQQVGEKIDEVLELEFDPSPSATFTTIQEGYSVESNVLIRFAGDSIDQSHQMESALNLRGGCNVEMLTVAGTHVTPISGIPEDFGGELGGTDNPRNQPLRKTKRFGDAAGMAALGMDGDGGGEDENNNREALVKDLLRCLSRLSAEAGAARRRSRWDQSLALPPTQGK